MQLESDALESQLDELRNQLENYERFQSGDSDVIAVDSFDELPQTLVKARMALRLSQNNLVDRLGMKEQKIQRYESTDYQSAACPAFTMSCTHSASRFDLNLSTPTASDRDGPETRLSIVNNVWGTQLPLSCFSYGPVHSVSNSCHFQPI